MDAFNFFFYRYIYIYTPIDIYIYMNIYIYIYIFGDVLRSFFGVLEMGFLWARARRTGIVIRGLRIAEG